MRCPITIPLEGFWPIDPMLLRLAKLGRLLRLMRLVRKLKGFDATRRMRRERDWEVILGAYKDWSRSRGLAYWGFMQMVRE